MFPLQGFYTFYYDPIMSELKESFFVFCIQKQNFQQIPPNSCTIFPGCSGTEVTVLPRWPPAEGVLVQERQDDWRLRHEDLREHRQEQDRDHQPRQGGPPRQVRDVCIVIVCGMEWNPFHHIFEAIYIDTDARYANISSKLKLKS